MRRIGVLMGIAEADREGQSFVCRHPGASGGNVTGFTLYKHTMSAKWLELLKEIAHGRPARSRHLRIGQLRPFA